MDAWQFLILGLLGLFGGALAYPDTLRLVDLRAHAMQEAYPHGYGMGVVVGLDERTVSRLAADAFPEARAIAVADAGVGSAATLIARHRSERGALR
jgi:malonyl CoA-acyl carrier protein transacylase